MAEKNIFVIFLKGSYHEGQEHIANKRQQKNPTPFLSKRGRLCRAGMVKRFNSDGNVYTNCFNINHV